MSNDIRNLLDALVWKLNRDLDRLHDELLAKLRTMARSTGQRTSQMSKREFSELIELIHAFGALRGVVFGGEV